MKYIKFGPLYVLPRIKSQHRLALNGNVQDTLKESLFCIPKEIFFQCVKIVRRFLLQSQCQDVFRDNTAEYRTWDSEISSSHSACPYSQQGGTCHFTCVHVCVHVCACMHVSLSAQHTMRRAGGGGWQGSDLSDREIATWFKWLACSRQSLDQRVNWLLSYLQSNAAELTCPTQPRPDLTLSLSLSFCPIFAMSPSFTHPHTHLGALINAMETSTDRSCYEHAVFWNMSSGEGRVVCLFVLFFVHYKMLFCLSLPIFNVNWKFSANWKPNGRFYVCKIEKGDF